MTSLGKILVFVNVVFGVGLLAWSLSAYTNRVDWFDRKGGEGEEAVKGQITQLKAEIDSVSKKIAGTQVDYNKARLALQTKEETRDHRARKFKERMIEARKGSFKVQLTLDRGPLGEGVMYDVDRQGGDILGPDNSPLAGLTTLQDKFSNEIRAIETLHNGKFILTDEQWQSMRNGQVTLAQIETTVPNLGIGDLRKLHNELSVIIRRDEIALGKQAEILTNLREQAVFLSAKEVNWTADLITLDRRKKQLEDRIRDVQASEKSAMK